MSKTLIALVLFFSFQSLFSQIMPSTDENIPYLVTFSKNADKTWGDDDNIQIYFFTIPQDQKTPFFIRVYDPDNGGKLDENRGGFNSKTKFSVYGGKGAHSNPDAQKMDPKGNYNSGSLLHTKTFSDDAAYDENWFSFGPINPLEGELQTDLNGYVFKLIVEGLDGDDGNLYKLSLSNTKEDNIKVEGGNVFTYEYCFRSYDKEFTVCHLYPFVAKGITAININVYDYDEEGLIRIISVAKKGEESSISKAPNWETSSHKIVAEELNTSLDVQFIKKKPIKNNNITVNIVNQRGENMAFFAVPIGGVPKYNYKIKVSK